MNIAIGPDCFAKRFAAEQSAGRVPSISTTTIPSGALA
jgi:hypothetical protein